MSEQTNTSRDYPQIVLGVIFIIISFIALRNPVASLSALVVYFGISAIIKGIMSLVFYKRVKDKTSLSPTLFIVIAIIDIILGILIMTNFTVGFLSVPFIFGLWFILDSISDLVFGRHIQNKRFNTFNIITSIITLILGIFMIFNPLSAYLTVVMIIGLYFLLTGIRYIVTGW